ncbi:F-box domain-containing protein [Mycena venus]|uniref:F-box domain-containing protein n=1 Tax=Mycena venus TaxID=2733690 RepID=A0A8H7CVS1_9AGAR|nr:F-box domain-containing protein [Mycena venus]
MSHNAALRAQVSELTSAICRQRQLLQEMQTRLHNLQTQLDSIVYPILSLPPEITMEIFSRCFQPERDSVNANEASLLLTHVCRAWRLLALSTPALWSTFCLSAVADIPHLSEIAQTWLQRTRNCPLSLKIDGPLPNVRIPQFGEFIEAFRLLSHRLRALELHLGVFNLERIDTAAHPVQFPHLQTLSIRLLFNQDPLNHRGPIKMFDGATLLREVLLEEVPPSVVELPWQKITKFTGEQYSPKRCLEALRLMPQLIECAFAVLGDVPDNLGIFFHPRIQHLTLFESHSDLGTQAASMRILEFLRLPALQALRLHNVDGFDAEALNLFLLRSSPPLRKLSIRPLLNLTSSRAAPELSPAFASLGLIDLEIWHTSRNFVPLFFDSLRRDATFLPRLQRLAFLGCGARYDGASMGEVVRIGGAAIAARNTLDCERLQSFRVLLADREAVHSFPAEVLLLFKNLKASGMDLYIGSTRESVI